MNDEQWFRETWDSLGPTVWAYAARRLPYHEVDDVVAETFLVAWRRRHERRPRIERAWLLSISHNIIGTRYRSRGRQQRLIVRLGSLAHTHALDHLPTAIDPDLADALTSLGDTELEALLLVALDELSPKEAAIVAGCSRQALRMRLHRARRNLQRTLPRRYETQEQPT